MSLLSRLDHTFSLSFFSFSVVAPVVSNSGFVLTFVYLPFIPTYRESGLGIFGENPG